MKSIRVIPNKIFTATELAIQVKRWRLINKKIVFTNGVFDLLHEGHISALSDAATYGHILIVGLNTDASVKRLKGENRPINNQQSRALVLASLIMVDAVVLFEEDTPLHLIQLLKPDVLVKGGDYTVEQIAGAKEVLTNGGEVKITAITQGFSTTGIIEKISSDTKL